MNNLLDKYNDVIDKIKVAMKTTINREMSIVPAIISLHDRTTLNIGISAFPIFKLNGNDIPIIAGIKTIISICDKKLWASLNDFEYIDIDSAKAAKKADNGINKIIIRIIVLVFNRLDNTEYTSSEIFTIFIAINKPITVHNAARKELENTMLVRRS